MSRRTGDAAAAAAAQASEAARVLQARGQESKAAQRPEPAAEPPDVQMDEGRIQKLRNNRTQPRVLDEIVRSRPGYKEQEEASAAPEPKEEKPEPKAKAPEPKVEPAPEPAKPEPAPTAAEPAATPEPIQTVRVKVDGEEWDAPKADVEAAGGVHAYQRDKAAENRLKKANDALAEAKRIQAQVSEWAKANEKPKTPEPTDDEFIRAKANDIRFGSDAEFAAALRDIMQRSNKPVDQNQIIEQAAAKIRHDDAVQQFDKEFADIVGNPMLLRLAKVTREEKLAELQKSGFQGRIDWKDFYFKMGNEIRSSIGRPSQPAAAPAETTGNPSQGTSDREARKASIVNLPAAAARAEAPKEDVPETREQVIAGMRKARGQLVG